MTSKNTRKKKARKPCSHSWKYMSKQYQIGNTMLLARICELCQKPEIGIPTWQPLATTPGNLIKYQEISQDLKNLII